jgi:hypothetical protein
LSYALFDITLVLPPPMIKIGWIYQQVIAPLAKNLARDPQISINR